MKPILISCLIAFCGLFSPVYAQVQQLTLAELPGEFGFSPTRLGYLDEWLESWVNEKKIPHAVTLVAKRGRIVHFKAYGSQNIQQGIDLKRDDIFRIASQTKAITTVAKSPDAAQAITEHSLRAGYCTEAAVPGMPAHTIMDQIGHRSSATLAKYFRPLARRKTRSLL